MINNNVFLEVGSLRRSLSEVHVKLPFSGISAAGLSLLMQNYERFKVNGDVLLGFVAYPGTIYHHIWPS
ncbi:hypothetical protein AAEH88_21475, partial [Shewanella algae]|uniref:hypothetical protein n=1 Tax=Shewanella algae TaxID=38313 RepID=UPI00313BD873